MKYSRYEIEDMYPYERDILLGLFSKQKEKEAEANKQNGGGTDITSMLNG